MGRDHALVHFYALLAGIPDPEIFARLFVSGVGSLLDATAVALIIGSQGPTETTAAVWQRGSVQFTRRCATSLDHVVAETIASLAPAFVHQMPLAYQTRPLGVWLVAWSEPHALTDYEEYLLPEIQSLSALLLANLEHAVALRQANADLVQALGERDRAVEALRHSEAELRAIFNSITQSVILIDRDYWVRACNEQARQTAQVIYGQGMQPGDTIYDYVSPGEQVVFDKGFNRALNGQVTRGEHTILGKDNAEHQLELQFLPVRAVDGEVISVCIMAEDVTQRKQEEDSLRETQRYESIGLLAGGIAHDFNNLLTGTLIQTSLALRELDDTHPALRHLTKVAESIGQAAALTGQLLAYAGKSQSLVERLDPNQIIHASAGLLEAVLPENIVLQFDLAPSLPLVEADRRQVQQILLNLVSNAGEACPQLGGRVTITTRQRDVLSNDGVLYVRQAIPAPGAYVTLGVSDTGSGMDEALVARIFDPFFTTKFTGRGLGLSAVLGIVRARQGGLQVVSRPGEGSTFTVLFRAQPSRLGPAVPADVDTEGQAMSRLSSSRDEATIPAGPRGRTILVVDDEFPIREALTDLLEMEGYTVLTAADGHAGVEMLAAQHEEIGAVILDLLMPVMGGGETLRAMRAINPHVKIILSSGYDEAEILRRLDEWGLQEEHPSALVHKPYDVAALLKTVRELLEPIG